MDPHISVAAVEHRPGWQMHKLTHMEALGMMRGKCFRWWSGSHESTGNEEGKVFQVMKWHRITPLHSAAAPVVTTDNTGSMTFIRDT